MLQQILEAREKQARIAANAKAKLNEITDDTAEDRAAEIETEFDAMMAEYDDLEAKCARLQRLIDVETASEERDAAAAAAERRGDPRRPNGDNIDIDGANNDDQPSYQDVFQRAICHGVAELTDAERVVFRSGQFDAETVPEMRAQSVGTTTEGGFVVPQGFSGELDRAMLAWGPMWDPGIGREMNTASGNKIPWPTTDDTGKSGRIKPENADVDDDGTDDVVFGEKQLDAYIFDTGMIRIPIELLQDSAFNMEALLDELFAERMGRVANLELTTGSGTSRPNGVVTASGLGKTAASATAIVADEIIDLLHSVDPAYRGSPKVRWMFNDTTLATIRKLKDGQGNYLWQMGDVRQGEPSRLLNYPYSINQAMADAATATKPMIFGDFNKYVVRKVIGFQMMTLRERYAEKFQIGMIGFKRFDGELLNSAAVKHMLMA